MTHIQRSIHNHFDWVTQKHHKFDFITPSFDVLRRFLVSTSRLKNKYVDYMFYPPIDTKINEHVCKSIKQGQTHKVIKTRSGKAHFFDFLQLGNNNEWP